MTFLHQSRQNRFQMPDPLQSAGFGYTLVYITDAVIINKQIQRQDGAGIAAGEGGVGVIFVVYMFRQFFRILLIKIPPVSDSVQVHTRGKAVPVFHNRI